MKKYLIISIVFLLYSCNNIIQDNIIVSKTEINQDGKHKYKIYLNSFFGETILYTNRVYIVGDKLK